MNTLLGVARYHLSDWPRLVLLPWGVTAFAFLVNMVILAMLTDPGTTYSGGLATFYGYLGIVIAITVTMSLPFGLTLGLSRRTYYLGTLVLILILGAVYSLGLAVLRVIEQATDGWGVALHFFRIPWLLEGSWYLTWLTAFVLVVITLVYGMWFGLVYRRWGFLGLLAFIATQVIVLLTAALIVTWTGTWTAIGDFFTTLTVLGLTGVLAVIAAALSLSGLSTIRRVTV